MSHVFASNEAGRCCLGIGKQICPRFGYRYVDFTFLVIGCILIYIIYIMLYIDIYITLHMDVRADFTVVIGYILEMHMDDGQHVDRKEGCRDQDH